MNNVNIKKTSVRWVVALKEEAQIILEHFKLKAVNEKTIYPIYKNEDETHWLIISGIGRSNAAASTAYLYSFSKASKYTSWVNIGIAGSDKGNYGDLYLVDKISTYQCKKSTYPSTMPKTSLPKMHLFTSEQKKSVLNILIKKLSIISKGAKKRDNREIYKKYSEKLNYWLLELDKYKNE